MIKEEGCLPRISSLAFQKKHGFDARTIWVDRLSRRVHFIKRKCTGTGAHVEDSFFEKLFKYNGLPDCILSDRDPKLRSQVWRGQKRTERSPVEDVNESASKNGQGVRNHA